MNEDFVSQLGSLGLSRGDIVLMHSSMKALGTKKTSLEFLEDIIAVLGPEGTLLLPALSYEYVTSENPYFSVSDTEPCIGLLPRTFFHMEGVIRSVHPTHSVCAYGKRAAELCARHYLDETPVGPNSPFMKLRECGGKILFIGDTVKCCTFMHGLEEIAKAPYCLKKERNHYIIKDALGNITKRDLFGHDFEGWAQEYQKIKDLLEYPEIRTGKVGEADCFLFDAAALANRALEKFRENPLYFVSEKMEEA